MWLEIFAGIVAVIVGLFIWMYKFSMGNPQFWTKNGIPFVDISKLSTFIERWTFGLNGLEYDRRIYQTKDLPFFGIIEVGTPILYLKDLDLIKKILVKDFDHFTDRRNFKAFTLDKYMSRMLSTCGGSDWKDLRVIMSPTFTTGKIRRMFTFFNQCGQHLVDYCAAKKTASGSDILDFEDCFGRFTLDAISSIAFGLQVDTFKDDSKFRKMVQRFQSVTTKSILKLITFMMAPKLAQLLALRAMDKQAMDFFARVVEENIQMRREGGVKRDDFLQLLLEAQAGQLKTEEPDVMNDFEKDAILERSDQGKEPKRGVLNDTTIISQCILFFSAGAGTLESVLSFAVYELAVNPEIQDKLAKEVIKAMEDNDGDLTYDVTNQLTYLDMVLSEVLRLHPPGFLTERLCVHDYKIPDTEIVLKKGTLVRVPIASIQTDEKYYPNPTKFNPENFNAENKAQRPPYAYSPFGQGPRNCIAMRFALTEAKAALAHLLYNFKLEPCDQTKIPYKVVKTNVLKLDGGMPLKCMTRR